VVFNDAAENISGYTLADLQGKNWFEVLVPKDRYPYVWDEFSRLTERGGIPKTSENPILTKGGEERVISWQNSTLSDGKVITGTISFGIDITERRKAELDLRNAEEKFSKTFRLSPDIIILTSLKDGLIVDVNQNATLVTGYSHEELIGQKTTKLDIWADPSERDRYIAMLGKEGRVHNFETRFIMKSGETRTGLISGEIIEIGGEKIILGVIRDITEFRRSEEKLRVSEERFSRAFFSSPAGMSITRIADGTFIDVNDAFLRIFEFSREETIGKRSTVLQMLTPGQQEELIRRQLETGGLNNEELITQARSGRVIHLLFSSRPIEVDGEPCHINTMIDITDRKKAEETARQQLEELQRWYEATLGREDRVRQLKHEVNQLLKRLGEPSRYASPEADQATPAAGSDAPV
jgi:PAS domain S-box-containing protein